MPTDNVPDNMWLPGDIISDEFEVVRCLGCGGMAAVYLVRHVDLRHLAAVKVPYRRLLANLEERSVFSREVQTWVSLPGHPHLVQCYFLRERNDLPIVFCEYVPSGSLETWMDRKRIHGLPHILDLGIQLAEAMQIPELYGIVHRDLKPSNCLLDDVGRLKVGDFGLAASWEILAKRRSQPRDDDNLRWRFSAGTQSYCSPEQFEGAPLTIESDIWSFGVALYELISGRRPGLGPAARHAILQYRKLPESSIVPNELWEFLLVLFEPEPQQRPSSFSVVSERLRELYRSVAGQEYPREFPVIERQVVSENEVSNNGTGSSAVAIDRALGGRGTKAKILARLAAQQEAARTHRSRVVAEPDRFTVHRLCASLNAIAGTHRNLGNLRDAIAAYGECIDHLQKLLREKRDSTTACLLLTAAHDRAVCRRQSGDLAGAISDYGLCIGLFDNHARLRFGHIFSNLLAGAYQNRAMALLKSMRFSDGIADATKAIEIREQLVHAEGRKQYAIDLAGTFSNRAVIFRNSGDAKRALEDYSAAHKLCMLPGVNGQFTRKGEVLATVCLNRAALHLAGGNVRAAKADSDEAIQIYEQECLSTRSTEPRLNLSNAYNNRANAKRCLGDLSGALEDIGYCRAIREELVEQEGLINQAGLLVRAYSNEALFRQDAGQPAEAFKVADRGVRVLESLIQRKNRIDLIPDLARLLTMRGTAQVALGKYELGAKDLDCAMSEYGRILDSGAADVVSGLVETLHTRTRLVLGSQRPDVRRETRERAPCDAVTQPFFNNMAQLVDRFGDIPMGPLLKKSLRVPLTQLRQSIVPLIQKRDDTEALQAAITAIDRFISCSP